MCHMYQLLHVQISDNYVSKYTSYELNAINNVTRSTDIHIFHITDIYPWTNMPMTLHMYVPLHFQCSIQIDPTLLHISIKNQYVSATSMPLPIPYIWQKPTLLYVHCCTHMTMIQDNDNDAGWWWCHRTITYNELALAKSVKKTEMCLCLYVLSPYRHFWSPQGIEVFKGSSV